MANENNSSRLALTVRWMRQRMSWSQEELAERAGLSPRTVQRVERGDPASSETVRSLARALRVSAKRLHSGVVRENYGAPWSNAIVAMTSLTLLVLAALPLAWPAASLISIGSVLFLSVLRVTGYSVRGRSLVVHRGGWSRSYSLTGLKSVTHDPFALAGSIRVFGVGGAFGWVGYFHNSTLGGYRAFGTRAQNAVIVKLENETLVVTPDSPGEFIEACESADIDRRS